MNKYAEHSLARPVWKRRRCVTKNGWRTEAQAKRCADRHPEAKLSPYRCAMCLQWHLTSAKVAA